VRKAVGVAGTVGQLAVLLGETTLGRAQLATLAGRLAGMTVDERRSLTGLDPARAPVIAGGALIVSEVLRRYDLDAITFSVRDLLDGAALEAALLPAREEAGAPPGAYTCC
jgi:exopolyphosphatase/guanosine-5'-triphosphate,3'-diphosphate pyrophosphatase